MQWLLSGEVDMDEVPEERLRAGEEDCPSHDHEGINIAEQSLVAHLASDHQMALRKGLSFGAVRGIHDRFHGEAYATED
jgi:hypothetical protein